MDKTIFVLIDVEKKKIFLQTEEKTRKLQILVRGLQGGNSARGLKGFFSFSLQKAKYGKNRTFGKLNHCVHRKKG